MPLKKKKAAKKKILNNVWLYITATIVALIPQFYIRSSEKITYYLFGRFRTYPGDLWYCWSHYLSKGFPYPREYPSGIQMLFSFLFRIMPKDFNYDKYAVCVSVFFGTFAVLTTYILFMVSNSSGTNPVKILVLWIFAPSFLFYGLYNVDFLCVFLIMAAYYLFVEEEYYLSAAILALGTSIKVFPIFLAPLFFFSAPRKVRFGSVASFIFVWLLFNVPFMVRNWEAWVFPFEWQINENFAKSATDGSYWWIFHKYLGFGGKLIGRLSLILFGGLYFYFVKRYKHLSLTRKCAIVMFLFLLTDRINSPQYNLYLLPFLAVADYKVDLRFFYLAEIPNVIYVMFMFFFKDNPEFYPGLYLQGLVLLKYISLIVLFYKNIQNPIATGGKTAS